MISYRQIRKIEQSCGTPFYIFDEKAFVTNYKAIVRAFKGRFNKFILAYSYKTNYIPYLCSIIKKQGGFAEVVSRLEYDLALKIGQKPSRIIFNGPVKKYEDLQLAIENGSIINIDSEFEAKQVTKYAQEHPNRRIKAGLRINIGLSDEAGQSLIQGKLKVGRFGISPESDSLLKVISLLTKQKNVIINSLHGHTSTTDRSVRCYEVITKTLCDIASKYLPQTIEYINIGGGIFGRLPPQMRPAAVPSFDDYARAVCAVLRNNRWVQRKKPYLVLEPGVAMSANTLSFVTKVMSIKQIRGKVFVTVDGSAFNTKPTFHNINQPFRLISKERTKGEAGIYNVVGSTCMEKDYLLTEVTGPIPEDGDYIEINNVGAYTIVLAPPFINPAPAILTKGGKGFKIIRGRQSLEDMFSNYSFYYSGNKK